MEQSTRPPRAYRFGVFEVDMRAGELRKQGLKIKLQDQPLEVLATLLERPADVVTREELRTKLWPADTFVDFDHGINIAINKIREALGDSAESPRFVETLAKRGYRFIAPVEPVDPETARSQAEAPPVPGATVNTPSPFVSSTSSVETKAPQGHAGTRSVEPIRDLDERDRAGRERQTRQAWAFRGILALVVIVGLALVAYLTWPPPKPQSGKTMLAVLPFENMSRDPEQEYFSDGLTEEMIARLGGMHPERLGVIARTSAMVYKHSTKSASQIGRELGVNYILEGSVRRAGERVRITAQLVQVTDQTHLWADSYERDLRDVLKIQSDVAQAIAEKIQLKLTPQQQARLASAREVNREAYDAYQWGRFHWNKRTGEGFHKAIGYFNRGITRDPNYAPAYAGLADAYGLLGSIGLGYSAFPPRDVMPKAKAAALRALEIDDTLAEAHASLAHVLCAYEWNWQEGEKEFKRAIELNPAYATAHQWYAWYLTAVGRLDEAVTENSLAQKHDPLSLVINTQMGTILLIARQYDQAIEQSRKALELDPNFVQAHFVLGRAYEQKGQFEEAIREFQKGKALSGNTPGMIMALGHAYAVSGRRVEAEKALAELKELSSQGYVPALHFAAIYGGLGDKHQAFRWLEQAYRERSDYLVFLEKEPYADPVRSDPKFQDLVRRIGLPP